eukprot:2972216-Rhodomonas_salina.3
MQPKLDWHGTSTATPEQAQLKAARQPLSSVCRCDSQTPRSTLGRDSAVSLGLISDDALYWPAAGLVLLAAAGTEVGFGGVTTRHHDSRERGYRPGENGSVRSDRSVPDPIVLGSAYALSGTGAGYAATLTTYSDILCELRYWHRLV